jgi:hypothetical protein
MSKGKQKAWRKGAQVVNALRRSVGDGHKVPSARAQKPLAGLVAGGAGVVAGAQRLAPQGYSAPRRRSDRLLPMGELLLAQVGAQEG